MHFKLDWKDLGALLIIALSLYLLLRLPDPRYGFSLLVLSLMYVVIRERGKVPASTAVAEAVALHRGALSVIRALNLKGNAIFVPPRGRLKEDKVFVPLSRGGRRVPDLSDSDVFNPGLFGSEMGVMLPSPGRGIIEELERAGTLDTSTLGSDECEALVEPFMGLEGLFGRIRIFDRGREVKIEVRGGTTLEEIKMLDKEERNLLRQYPPPPLSAIFSAVARVKRRPMRIRSAFRDGERVDVLLEGVGME